MKELKEFWKKAENDLVFTQANALAYTTLVSLVPLLAVAFFLFKAFGGFDKLATQIQPLIESNLAPAFSDRISGYIDGVLTNVNSGTIGVIGVIGFVITALTTLATIEKTFNIIWGVRKNRSWTSRITIYWTFMTIGPLLLGASILFGSQAFAWLKADGGFIAGVLVFLLNLVPYMASGILFSVLFFIFPNASVSIKDALKAGVITGVVFELAKLVYSLYVKRMIVNDVLYGALIVLPLFLLWLYVAWLIVLFGAELCCYLQFKRLGIRYKFNWEERLTAFAISDILEMLAEAGQTKKGGLTAEHLLAKLQMPFYELNAHLHFLEDEGWIVRSGRKYHLALSRPDFNMDEISKSLDGHRYVPKGKIASHVYQKMKALWRQD